MANPADWRRLHENLQRVRARMAEACERAGRPPGAVRLVAVTKYVDLPVMQALLASGVEDLGESRVQQLVSRATALGARREGLPDDGRPGTGAATGAGGPQAGGADVQPGPRWHLVGHLQRNKVKSALAQTRIVHSVDSERLAEELEKSAAGRDALVDMLIEVNVAGEASKSGVAPAEVDRLAEFVRGQGHLRWRGLMVMAPLDPDPEHARPHFARTRELLASLRRRGLAGPDCGHLSMGMSQDYGVAIEEGATLVRIGSALFEGLREPPAEGGGP